MTRKQEHAIMLDMNDHLHRTIDLERKGTNQSGSRTQLGRSWKVVNISRERDVVVSREAFFIMREPL